MKIHRQWIYWTIMAASGSVFAEQGIYDYRSGQYFEAASALVQMKEKTPTIEYYLGKMRLYGYGLVKNNKLSLELIQHAAEKGDLASQQWLGRYYLAQNQPDTAFDWFKRAAQAGDIQAQVYCIGASLLGYGTKTNPDAARNFAISAAKSGDPLAQFTLAMEFLNSRSQSNKKLGLIWLKKSADKGYVKALTTLGQQILSQSGGEGDREEAMQWLMRAVKQKDTAAMLVLGNFALEQGDEKKAFSWLSQAANAHDVQAEVALANMYANEKSMYFDKHQSYLWALKAAEQGSVDAQNMLADFYRKGIGIEQDGALAKSWAEKANATLADQKKQGEGREALSLWLSDAKNKDFSETVYKLNGIDSNWYNPEAQRVNQYNPSPQMLQLGRRALYQPKFILAMPDSISLTEYFNFIAPMLIGSQASKWYFPRYPVNPQIEALLNSRSFVLQPREWHVVSDDVQIPDQETDSSFAAEYLNSKAPDYKLKANYQQIVGWLYQRAILGEDEAQFELGQLYEYGIVVSKNIAQAINYYELAALQQDVRAEYNLGVLYLEGKTNPVDYKKGLDWISDAAFKGNPYAQYVLANIYDDGLKNSDGTVLVEPDHEEARSLHFLASANHDGWSQFRLADDLAKDNNLNLSLNAQQKRIALIKRLYSEAVQNGVLEAVLPKAFYDAMDHDPVKQQKAFDVAQAEVKSGNMLAALLLGMMYERGITVPADPVKAVSWYQQVPNNPLSAFILGSYMLEGQAGLSSDLRQGRILLQRAADAGFSYAYYNLAILKQRLDEQFVTDLEKANGLGNSKAGLLLADYDMSIALSPEAMTRSRTIYQHFAEKGDRDAQVKLGYLYESGLGAAVDLNAARDWYTFAAKQHQPLAQYLLGQYYLLGLNAVAPDYAEAKIWFSRAAQAYPPAAVAMGFMLETVDDNYIEAKTYYQSAHDRHDPIGSYNLGLLYEEGKGEPVNLTQAKTLYEKAAQGGVGTAMSRLGRLYWGINPAEHDEKKAYEWYQKAALAKDRDGLYRFGKMAENGIGMKADAQLAIHYYQQAADLGYATAKLALARIYLKGDGVSRDVSRSAALYQQLAEQDNPSAQYQLAMIYLGNGLGTPQLETAKQWLLKAAANGNLRAKAELMKLESKPL